MFNDLSESCSVCGGDGEINNSFGARKTCPICHGSGRRQEDTGHWDVTKTKPSHYRRTTDQTDPQASRAKRTVPLTARGAQLADEVWASALEAEQKTKLVRDIVEYEASHGVCTKTFTKKLRKRLRTQT